MTPTEPITVSRKDVKDIIDASFKGYKGRRIQVVFRERVTLSHTYWDGGCKTDYAFLDVVGGKRGYLPSQNPFRENMEGEAV